MGIGLQVLDLQVPEVEEMASFFPLAVVRAIGDDTEELIVLPKNNLASFSR